MNRTICHILCSFIIGKENRKKFRKKHLKYNNKYYNVMEKLDNINELLQRQKFLSYHNINKILSIKDKYKNQKCFIIGSSPSLKKLDLTKLNNSEYKIFTVNKGYKLKELGLLHSNFHVIVDGNGYNEMINEFDDTFFDTCFSYCGIDFVNYDAKNIIYFDRLASKRLSEERTLSLLKHYQDDLTKPLFDCETVVAFALQIATYMGFGEIYFIGVDLDYNNTSGYIYKSTEGEKERQVSISYNTKDFMLEGLESATKYLNNKGINLYNASPCGILNCMPRVDYNKLF